MDFDYTNMLEQISGINAFPEGEAYNLRLDGQSAGRKITENIDIITKTDKSGIDVYIKPNTANESVHIPVIISQSGLKETVFNDFFIGENSNVTILAGCGIHNCGQNTSEHSGIHSFYIGKNAHVKYIEKHYGEGDGNGKNVMNPTTIIHIEEGGYMEMDTVQIKGVDSTDRKTSAVLENGATLVVYEKIMTHGHQEAKTEFKVELNGENSGTHVVSRSVAKDASKQLFLSDVSGNSKCNGHTECDAIVMDNATVSAIPKIIANHVEASLVHEAAIGKIAGEQIVKLMTLGLTEKEAEEQIINGFLK